MEEKRDDSFQVFAPIHLSKGKDATGKTVMRMAGIASTSSKDADGEFLDPSGFELDYFLKYGYMNWNHQTNKDPLSLIGKPTKALKKSEGLHVDCELFANNPRAKEVYALGEILEAQGLQLGFSIEGKVLERDKKNPKIVKKAKITGCAITPNPKNKDTVAEIIKGNSFETISAYEDKSEDEREKALAAGSASGQALSKESLDAATKVTTYGDHNWSGKIHLSKGEVIEQLTKENPQLKLETVEELYSLIETIEKSIIMTDAKISPEAIEKAYETLGLKKGEDAPEESTAETTAEANTEETPEEESAETPETETEETPELEKGYASMKKMMDGMDYKKMSKKDKSEMKKMISVHLKKMEDDEKDEVEKGLTADKIKAASIILEAAGAKVSFTEAPESEEVSKSEETDIETSENADPVATLIKSEFAALREESDAKNAAQATLIKGLEDQLAEVRTHVDEIGSRSPGAKSVVTANAIEKSWDADLEKAIPGADTGAKTLSVSRNKPQILDILEDTYFEKGELVDPKLAKATQMYESSGQLSKAISDCLKGKGYELIQ